jgi:hypothetical protein
MVAEETDVSEEHIASIFRRDSDSPWFAARMHFTAAGEERLLQRHLHGHGRGATPDKSLLSEM